MKRSPAIVALALASLLGTGCSISSLVNKLQDETDESIDLVCSCDFPSLPGFDCEDFLSGFLDVDDQCVVDALEADKDSARDTLNCMIDVQKSYNQCLEDELECSDVTSWDNCQNRLDDLDDCPRLPQSVEDEIAKCG
ncbi:hypothetical protein PPSIR1_07812 [Plesiocystis pacifica SIR-1]|uniref:Lipoprotein n=1 Tax=Plesiocystis pacifica SIR-1 TaxID=391625 RepID=A6GCV7_9BACT|nr:hypothetical protein [Plesiocystis pacifica]EDM76281.1 hypothetical protein PPSIR1_07812 [Plesiocystis pacifica SIR-1]